jgi:arabinogalactan endo-1,4-beta-galactosidase
LVQLGNEITPGMLLHICDAAGMPLRDSPVQGSISNWANLGALLRAGASAVREVDPDIGLMLHIDRCGDKGAYTGYALQTSVDFISQAKTHKVEFEYFGESCYQQYQGDVNSVANTKLGWSKTLGALADRFPDLRFLAAEYGPMQREINDVLFSLPEARGAGSFAWEPTREGDWNRGHTLFSSTWPKYTATAQLSLYDQMRKDYASRKSP